MRRLFAILLSLLTGIGGHYLNRRWDRAAFFLGLLFVGMLVAYTLLWGGGWGSQDADPYGLLASLQQKTRFLAGGFVFVLLVSAAVTWRDSRPSARVTVPWRGPVAVVGAVLTTLMSLVLVIYIGWVSWAYLAAPEFAYDARVDDSDMTAPGPSSSADESALSEQDRRRFPVDDWFMQSLYLGGSPDYKTKLKPLPGGEAYLVGRLDYAGAPVVGAKVVLTVNGAYASEPVTTDAQGRYTLRVPPGEWLINAIEVQTWPGKPGKGQYLLVSALESAADIHRRPHQLRYDNGLAVTASATPELSPALTVRIREHLHLAWPSPQQHKAPAEVATARVQWSAYPEAVHYHVNISEVTRRGNSATYVPVVAQTRAYATELPLAALPFVPGDTEAREYAVEVTALAEDGTFLSVSEHAFKGSTFTLTDGNRLIGDDTRDLLYAGTSIEDVRRMFTNDTRLDAVVLLIREDMLDAAEPLLAKVDIASPGRKAAVTGFLRAKQNRCEEAVVLLNQARGEGGQSCVPSEYRAGCR